MVASQSCELSNLRLPFADDFSLPPTINKNDSNRQARKARDRLQARSRMSNNRSKARLNVVHQETITLHRSRVIRDPTQSYTTSEVGAPRSIGPRHDVFKPDLTILDPDGNAILQRFSPSSLDQRTLVNRRANEGFHLLNTLLAALGSDPTSVVDPTAQADMSATSVTPTADDPSALDDTPAIDDPSIDADPSLSAEHPPTTARHSSSQHLGIWHTTGRRQLRVTSEQLQHRPEGTSLLRWARTMGDIAVTTMTGRGCKPYSRMHPSFRANVLERAKCHEWLEGYFGTPLVRNLHPMWSTVAFFTDITPGLHRDTHDETPSILFSFGHAVDLQFPELDSHVRLDPGDFAIFDSRSYFHQSRLTSPDLSNPIPTILDDPELAILSQRHPDLVRLLGDIQNARDNVAAGRWAFSGFLRSDIFHRRHSCPIDQKLLDRIERDHASKHTFSWLRPQELRKRFQRIAEARVRRTEKAFWTAYHSIRITRSSTRRPTAQRPRAVHHAS